MIFQYITHISETDLKIRYDTIEEINVDSKAEYNNIDEFPY